MQGWKNHNVGISISLYPPYSPTPYLNHQHICREGDVIHFIHDFSPHIILRKDETLDDKDPPSQPIKEHMNDDRKDNLPTRSIPSSSTYPFDSSMFPYTINFKQIHNKGPSSSQLKNYYRFGYDIISKQGYSGQWLGKYEQEIKISINPPSQASTEGLGHPHHSPMDGLLKVQRFKECLVKCKIYHPSKHASTSNNPPPYLPSTSAPCHTIPTHVYTKEKLATRVFWRLKYDKMLHFL